MGDRTQGRQQQRWPGEDTEAGLPANVALVCRREQEDPSPHHYRPCWSVCHSPTWALLVLHLCAQAQFPLSLCPDITMITCTISSDPFPPHKAHSASPYPAPVSQSNLNPVTDAHPSSRRSPPHLPHPHHSCPKYPPHILQLWESVRMDPPASACTFILITL